MDNDSVSDLQRQQKQRDDDLGGAIDLNEDWFNDEFFDIDEDDVARLDHLLDEYDEIREVQSKMMNLNSKQKNKNVEDFGDGNENVPMGIDDGVEVLKNVHTHLINMMIFRPRHTRDMIEMHSWRK
ncbi:hypothetical protein Ccrd_010097 [Cynara cardunculus var. scolymus]|uniref:Uncharacterized protein n=1 Tax=Cynara cardunculus var. scolymus TaxID=59895 RepID=A0A103YLV5_CYNCS|nr:hypothetical protein Ccrd_010097 [Cynara cardunculus var. scolymus]